MLGSALKIIKGWWRQWFPQRCRYCHGVDVVDAAHHYRESDVIFKFYCRRCRIPFGVRWPKDY